MTGHPFNFYHIGVTTLTESIHKPPFSSPMTINQDREISGYTILRQIGRGNTSLVYLAIDPQGQEIAIKIPQEQTLKIQEAAERFGNEVRLTLQSRHPHIIHGFAGTPFGPKAFLSLRYYSNGALNEQLMRLPTRTLPFNEAMRILADIASALAYLHKLGAVHQDVKTHNVYVSNDGRAALGNLGSAYFVAQGGKISGSPYYMAPEIYHGETSSSASDVYSFGILMYELLTGERPYSGNTYEELMVAHLSRFPSPLIHQNPQVSRSLSRLAELSLAKRANDRPSADTLRRAFLAAMGEKVEDENYAAYQESQAPKMGRNGRLPTATSSIPAAAPKPAKAEAPAAKPEPAKRSFWDFLKRK